MKGAVDVPKVFERKRGRVMSVANGRCFESGGAFQYDGRRSGIGRGHEPCFQEGRVDGGGEGEAKVSERAAAKVCVSQRRVWAEELVHGVDFGVRWFAVDRWDCGVFEALDKIIDGGGRHGGGEELINNWK